MAELLGQLQEAIARQRAAQRTIDEVGQVAAAMTGKAVGPLSAESVKRLQVAYEQRDRADGEVIDLLRAMAAAR